jgi:hypothetical protein
MERRIYAGEDPEPKKAENTQFSMAKNPIRPHIRRLDAK